MSAVLELSRDHYPYPVKSILQYLDTLPKERLATCIQYGNGCFTLRVPRDIILEAAGLSGIQIPRKASAFGEDMDMEAKDLQKILSRLQGNITEIVEAMEGLDEVLTDPSGEPVSCTWELQASEARLEPMRGAIPANAAGVLLLVRETRDRTFESRLVENLKQRLMDPYSGEEMDEYEAQSTIDAAMRLDISQSFLSFLRETAISRSRIGIYNKLANRTMKILQESGKRAGFDYLKTILDFQRAVIDRPEAFRFSGKPDYGAEGMYTEIYKLAFHKQLPIWFTSRGILGSASDADEDLVSYAFRVGGENPQTGRLAIEDRLITMARERETGDNAYLPPLIVYAMLFDDTLKHLAPQEAFERIMGVSTQTILHRFVEKRSGNWEIRPEVHRKIQQQMRAIRNDLLYAWSISKGSSINKYFANLQSTQETADIRITIPWSLANVENIRDGIVTNYRLKDENRNARWLRDIQVVSADDNSRDRWFDIQVKISPAIQWIQPDGGTHHTQVRRVPSENQKILRLTLQSFPDEAANGDRTENKRYLDSERNSRMVVLAREVPEKSKTNKDNLDKACAAFFVENLLLEHFLLAVVKRLEKMTGSTIAVEILRLQQGNWEQFGSQRLYALGHLLEHRLASRTPVFQQGFDMGNKQNESYRKNRARALASYAYPMEMEAALKDRTVVIHLARYALDGDTQQAMATLFVADPSPTGVDHTVDRFRYQHARTLYRSSRDRNHASLLAEGWVLGDALQSARDLGATNILLVLSADGWKRESRGYDQGANQNLGALYTVAEKYCGPTLVVPMLYRHHLMFYRKGEKRGDVLILDGVNAWSGKTAVLDTVSGGGTDRLRLIPVQGLATLRTVQDGLQRGLMAYAFPYLDQPYTSAKQEMARFASVERHGWVHRVLLAHHAYRYEKIGLQGDRRPSISAMKNEPPVKLDPWGMTKIEDRGWQKLAGVTVDWLGLLSKIGYQGDLTNA
ncbi:hypothetical protein Atc_1217 [Acidithiobacillus caldus SM-1]|uniref:Uncharacterized protein n=2 Tax=Acidithiobacillus caldus TaxID=33059 RepID=F9ZMV7_ACICS|nr:hypothetical protein [Acidithiobacillus caldus]AEK57866.1 hypothetical protein Atc_1217 [Acidithiobacillus caldus SM-1]OFC60505.1 hypothetical protein BAE30_08010 [Acidithiobacillus caldus]